MTETAVEPVAAEPEGGEATLASGSSMAAAGLVAPAAPVDHKGLLEELAGHIRDIPLPGRNKHVTDLLAFLASKGL